MLEQRTDAWVKFRKNMIGASDAPIIMGESPWKTPYQLWLEKMDQGGDPFETNYAMERGNRLEDIAIESFNRKMGLAMKPKVVISENIPWMMASLDGITPCRKFILEVKCPGNEDHALAIAGHIPQKYYAQVQHQLAVTDLNMAYYYSFDGEDGVVVHVNRDDEYIDKMRVEENKFYRCMVDFIAPPLCDKDYVHKNDLAWVEVVKKYQEVSQQAKIYANEEEKYKNMLIAMSNNRNCKGGGIKLTRVGRKGTVDYSKIPELEDIDLEEYRKPGSYYWTVKWEKGE